MVTEINNLDNLTNKIYLEGIEKAQVESKEIVAKAKAKQQQIIHKAKEEAKKIVAKAERDSSKLTRSIEKELQLKGQQFISDLKGKIRGLLSKKILESHTKEALIDITFLQSAISNAIDHWKSGEELGLMLPEVLEKQINTAFRNTINQNTDKLDITFSDKINAGFRIIKKSEAYQISFTEEDFISLFRPYLNEQTDKLLFNTVS